MSDNYPESFSSPYNFVPLSKHIVFPDWADCVSHDIPFSDGLDGEISFKIETVSDVFIRNGGLDRQHQDPHFFNIDNHYYIPPTSIKGMIRNVMEIITFGKMQHVADRRYAIRDLHLQPYIKQFTENLRSKVNAGFLDISKDDWRIIPCKYALCLRSKLDPNFGNNRRNGSAADKYKDFIEKLKQPLIRKAHIHFIESNGSKNIIPHYEAEFVQDNGVEGVLVFTGQPQDYNPNDERDKNKKKHEFFFYEPSEKDAFYVDGDPTLLKIDEYGNKIRPNQQDFLFIYKEQSNQLIDFKQWEENKLLLKIRNQYKDYNDSIKGCIPIFYINDGNQLRFGLSQLFRLAGKVSVPEAIRTTNEEHYTFRNETFKPDMTDLIFGYVTPNKSLRGRVQFSACKADGQIHENPKTTLVLGTPKPTFYPAYIKQKYNDKISTFLDEKAEIRGWKRYPALVEQEHKTSSNENINVALYPLPKGSIFYGKVRYHNLRHVELGALLWALQMNNPKYYCHSIGMAKPYGLGKIKIFIESIDNKNIDDTTQYIHDLVDEFQKYIINFLSKDKQFDNEPIPDKFTNLTQIKALLTMSYFHEQLLETYTKKKKFTYLESPQDYSNKKGHFKSGGPSFVLAPYPENDIQKDLEEIRKREKEIERASIKLSPEEQKIIDFINEFDNNMSLSISKCIDKIKKLSNNFTEKQIQKILSRYKTQKSNPMYNKLHTILLEHKKQ